MIEVTREQVERQKERFSVFPFYREIQPDLELLKLTWKGTNHPGATEAAAITYAKWEIVRENEGRIAFSGGCGTCGFCLRYVHALCQDCPVKESTGSNFCSNVPYHYDYEDAKPNEVDKRKGLIDSIFLTLRSIVKVIEE
jgi:hypothetical protein